MRPLPVDAWGSTPPCSSLTRGARPLPPRFCRVGLSPLRVQVVASSAPFVLTRGAWSLPSSCLTLGVVFARAWPLSISNSVARGLAPSITNIVARGWAPSITNIERGTWAPHLKLFCGARPPPSQTLLCGARPPSSSTLFRLMRRSRNFTNNNLFAHLHPHICDFGTGGSPRQISKKQKNRGKPLQFFFEGGYSVSGTTTAISTSSTNYPTLSPQLNIARFIFTLLLQHFLYITNHLPDSSSHSCFLNPPLPFSIQTHSNIKTLCSIFLSRPLPLHPSPSLHHKSLSTPSSHSQLNHHFLTTPKFKPLG